MRLEAPFWWYRDRGAVAGLLAPLGMLYGRIAEARARGAAPYRSRLPVICIGNFTAGGGGGGAAAPRGGGGAAGGGGGPLAPRRPGATHGGGRPCPRRQGNRGD